MSYERETMEQIRFEVDKYDKYQQLDQKPAIGMPSNVTEPRVFLCAEVRRKLTVSAYGNILSEDLGIVDFVTPLLNLLHGKIGNDARFNQVSYQIYSYFTPLIYQVTMYSSCRVCYLSQETGDLQREIIHATSAWQSSGPRYDFVIIQGQQRSSLFFAQVYGFFSVCIGNSTFQVAIVKPFTRKPRNRITGYVELEETKGGCFEFCFIESIIQSVHILPPTPHNYRSVVQDLTDGDIYLRLSHFK